VRDHQITILSVRAAEREGQIGLLAGRFRIRVSTEFEGRLKKEGEKEKFIAFTA
jgi:hypothetical protein